MTDRDDDEHAIERALFRYRLIAGALEAPASARRAMLREVADEDHLGPGGVRVRISVRTLERWIARYEQTKLAGLMRAKRKDKGTTRSVSPAALARVITLRKEEPSRFVPDSRYGMSENLMAVRRALRALCTTWGLPRRIYVDNGPGYQANRFHFGCAQLGIDLVHSKPYVSEGRGLVERFNCTVKEAFEIEVRLRPEPPTLDELNAFWRAWLDERYHRREHSETGEPPLERWTRLLVSSEVRRADPMLLDEVLRLRARRTVHPKTSTVEVGAVRFVVDTSLRKRRVDVLYDPHDLSSVLVYFDGRRIQRAQPQIAGETPSLAPAPTPRPTPSVDYLALLRRDHERRRNEELSTIRFRAVPDVSVRLTIGRLLEQLRVCSGRALGDVERQHAAEILDALAPLEIAICDAALKTATTTLGHGLHASQYLTALREHVLAARKNGRP